MLFGFISILVPLYAERAKQIENFIYSIYWTSIFMLKGFKLSIAMIGIKKSEKILIQYLCTEQCYIFIINKFVDISTFNSLAVDLNMLI